MKKLSVFKRFAAAVGALALVSGLALLGCDPGNDSTSSPGVSGVTVSPATAAVNPGGTARFTAVVAASGGAADTVTWNVTGGIVETSIDDDGLLTVAAGETAAALTVTATSTFDATKDGTATVTVSSTAVVAVSGSEAQTVTWSVSPQNTGTSIDGDGLLTIAADETAGTLTVKAVSTVTAAKFDTAEVTVTEPSATPTVGSVTVSPLTATVVKGQTQLFTADVAVSGGAAQTVNWSVAGNANAGTTIDGIDGTGLLTVAAGETAGTLTVTATSTVDAGKSGTATITVVSPAASVAAVTIIGSRATAIVQANVTITLTHETFRAIATNTVVTPWFTNLPAGLIATAPAVSAGATEVVIAVSGTPTASGNTALAITIPANVLGSNAALTVTANNDASFNIGEPGAPVIPQASPAGVGYHDPPLTVTLTSRTEGAAFWYTLDGPEPTLEALGTEYTGPVTIFAENEDHGTDAFSVTLRSVAVKDGVISAPRTSTYQLKPHAAIPNAGIDYVTEELTGLEAGVMYHLYTGSYVLDANDYYVSGGTANSLGYTGTTRNIAYYIGGNVALISNGGTNTRVSAAQILNLSRPAAPAVSGGTEPTAGAGLAITGLTTAMEWRRASSPATTWATYTGTPAEFAAGTYQIRNPATVGSFSSTVASVTINPSVVSPYGIWEAGNPTKLDPAETLTDAMVYFANSANFASVATNYTLKLNAGTDSMTGRKRLRGGASHATGTETYFFTGSTLTIEGPSSGTAVIQTNATTNSMIEIRDLEVVLKGNITFTHTAASFSNPLISVINNAVLEMYDGVLITGNPGSTGASGGGGGVRVTSTGTFNMKGGTISGNTIGYNGAGNGGGGGVCIGATTGTFSKTGGIIYGSSASGGNANIVTSETDKGAAVFINDSVRGYPHIETDVTGNIGYTNAGGTTGSGW
ncbi:hypothetical protein AGMMS49944_28500 [Spirochaetia bacterium]|nr:hypothetical protein AGMMS49944_28500 [Spirochaetia bacterium]